MGRLTFARPLFAMFIAAGLALSAQTAQAECNCVAIAGDVAGSIQAEIAKADGLYVRGDFSGALAIYAKAYGTSKDSALLYAQAMAQLQLGAQAKARALFQQYLSASGTLAYRDRAEANLSLLGGATAAISSGGGMVGGLAGDVGRVGGGVVGGVAGDVDRPGTGVVGGVAGTGVGVVGGVRGKVEGKAKVGHSAGIALGVIAVVAIGAVAIHAIAAGLKDDIELDAKFDLGLGLTGVSVGISAFYVAGLTAATGAAAGAPCLGMPTSSSSKPIGLAGGFRF